MWPPLILGLNCGGYQKYGLTSPSTETQQSSPEGPRTAVPDPQTVSGRLELRACSRTVGYFTPVHERGTKWDNIEEHIPTSFKAGAVDRLYEPGATQGSVAKELGITGTQLKSWRLEIEAFGSAEAKRRQKADAAELDRLRKENKRLALEGEILHKASAFFATRAVKP